MLINRQLTTYANTNKKNNKFPMIFNDHLQNAYKLRFSQVVFQPQLLAILELLQTNTTLILLAVTAALWNAFMNNFRCVRAKFISSLPSGSYRKSRNKSGLGSKGARVSISNENQKTVNAISSVHVILSIENVF